MTPDDPQWYEVHAELVAFARTLVASGLADSQGLLEYLEKPWKWTREHAEWVERGRPASLTLKHFRVTRPEVYSNPNCPGHKDKSARQGYYVDAVDEDDARRVARALYADRIRAEERLDVQVWR